MAKLTKKQNYISDMYVTYFGRVATKDEIESFNDVKSLSEITAEVRVNAANESGLKGSDYLNSIIKNLFGRSEANAFESKYAKKLEDNVYYNLPIATIIKKGSKDDKGVYNAKKLVAQMAAAEDGSYELDNITQENYKSIYNVKKGELTVKTIDELEAKISNVPDIINGKTEMLTTSFDAGKEFTGTAKNDLFLATDAETQFSIADTLDGGKGIDTLRLIDNDATAGYELAIPVAASIKNIEIIDIIGNSSVTADTSDTTAFAGVTDLHTTSTGANTSTAAATTNINATANGTAGADIIIVKGGKDVTVVSKNNSADAITVGTIAAGVVSDAAAGKVSVTSKGAATTATNSTNMGAITVNGGTEITVNQNVGTTTLNSTNVGGVITVNGNEKTTTVTVNQSAAATAAAATPTTAGVVGYTVGVVTITDNNAATAADTIKTVTAKNFASVTVNSSALETLKLESTGNASGAVTLNQTAADTTVLPTTLTVNSKGGSFGAVSGTMAAKYTAVNINSSANTTIADAAFAANKTLTVDGAGVTTFTAFTAASNTALTSIVSKGAGLTIGTELATTIAVTGGAGVENIKIAGTTKTVDLGAGDDIATISTTTMGAGGSLKGGAGNDTLVVNTNGSDIAGLPQITGFETLRVEGANAQGSHNAHTFTALEVGTTNAAGSTFTNVAAGVGLTVLAAPTGGTTVTLANATGTADVFNLTLSNATAATQAAGTVTIAGVETINITTVDAGTAANTAATADSIVLDAADATSIVVSGNNGLAFTAAGSSFAKVTNFDASAVVGNDTTDTAANLAVTFVSTNSLFGSSVSIKGGAGNDILTGTITANDTIIGGAGNDTLTYTGGKDILTGGAGDDTFVISDSAPAVGITSYGVNTKVDYATITDLTKGDKIDVGGVTGTAAANGSLGAKVTLGAGATFDNYLDAAAAAATGATQSILKWFQFENNTYLVVDDSNNTIFNDGTDAVIKITGLVDLSTSTSATDVITIA